MPVLVLAAGWLLLQLVARICTRSRTRTCGRRRAVARTPAAAAGDAADRSAAVEQARERQLYASALDVGYLRLIGPVGTSGRSAAPDRPTAPRSAPGRSRSSRGVDDSWRVMSVRVSGIATRRRRHAVAVLPRHREPGPQLALVRRRVVTVALLAAPMAGLLGLAVAPAPPARCADCNNAPADSTRRPTRHGSTTRRPGSPRSTTSPGPWRTPRPPATTNRPPEPPAPSPPHGPSRPPPRTNCVRR